MSVRKAFAWSLAGQLLSFVATFGTTVALARILSPREVGIYAAGLAVVGMLQAISAFGVGTYIVRERDLHAGTLATAFTINAGVCALLAGIVFAASWSPWVTAGEPAVGRVLRLLALIPLLGALEFRPATMLQREMGFRAISLVTIARTVASAVVSVAAALMGASALSAAYGGLAYAIVGVVGFGLAARGHVSLAMSVRGWRTMVAFGLKTLAIGGVSVLTMRLSDFLLGRILGFAPLGYYSRASGLSNTVFQNLYGSAARVLFAKLADDDRAGAGLRTAYLRGLEVILALMWPLLGGIAVLAGPVTLVLFGERWLPAAPPLAILMLAQMLALAFAMNHELFVLRDQVGRQGKLEAIRSVIGLAAFAYGCTYGLAGAAAGRVVDSLVGVALYVPMLSGLSGVRKRELLVVYARAGLLTVAAVAPAAALMLHYDWAAAVPLRAIAVAVAIGVALWAALLRLVRHPLVDEIARVVAATPARALWTPLSTPPS